MEKALENPSALWIDSSSDEVTNLSSPGVHGAHAERTTCVEMMKQGSALGLYTSPSVLVTQVEDGDKGILVNDDMWPNSRSYKQRGNLLPMDMKRLKFELPVSNALRATKFNPFQRKFCTPIHFGKTLKTGPHMRGFWFATVSFFLAFLGLFSMAPLMVLIREDIGICDNQVEVDAGIEDCVCTHSCKSTIGNLKIASLCSTVLMRLFLGGLLEKFGPRKVQCSLLLAGSIFMASASLIENVPGLIIVGVLIGTIGASFVANQFWMALLFCPEILGLVNGTSGGWGNLGGGVANMVMPYFEKLTGNWRTAFLIPAGILFPCSVFMFFFSMDTPIGPIVIERDLKKKKASPQDYIKCFSDYRVCILALHYGACFGAELTMNWELATHFHDYFGMSVVNAGWLSSGFGLMNLFARSMGGSISDFMNGRMGIRGRLFVQFLLLFCEACCLLIFGFMSKEMKWGGAFVVMLFFSIFTQAAEGSTFAIVPYVQPNNLGIVSAITAAGGNLFAALLQALIYKNISDFLLPFKLHAIFVFFGAFLTFCFSFDNNGSLLFKPTLARYCRENVFSYVLEWELQSDLTYRVNGSYLSPAYLRKLYLKNKEEQYVKAAKKVYVEYGEGLIGRIGETRRACMVQRLDEELVGLDNKIVERVISEDEIKSVLFFPSFDGKKVIEVGGCNQYELSEGVSLAEIELILTCDSDNNFKDCLNRYGIFSSSKN